MRNDMRQQEEHRAEPDAPDLGPLERLEDAIPLLRAVVVTDERLRAHDEADHGSDGETRGLLRDADGGEGARRAERIHSAVLRDHLVEHHRDNGGCNLHDERGDAEGHDLHHQRAVGTQARKLPGWNGARFEKMKYHRTGAMPNAWPATVAQALPATPMPKHRDEQQVEHDAHHGAEHHGQQRERRLTRRAQEVVQAHAERLEGEEHADDLDERLGGTVEVGGGR